MSPVGHVDVDDAGLKQLPLLVGAGHQNPALVVRQAVAHEEHVVAGSRLARGLPQVRLLGARGTQDEGRREQLHRRIGVLRQRGGGGEMAEELQKD